MKKIDLGQTIQILANVGVLGGIVFLAIEVSQNQASLDQANELSRTAVLEDATDTFNEFRAMLARDEELNEIWSSRDTGRELSASEARRFQRLCANWFWLYATMYERFRRAGDEARAIQGPGITAGIEFANPMMRTCWEPLFDVARNWGYGSFVDTLLDSRIDE